MKNSKFNALLKTILEDITTSSAGIGATQPTTDSSTDSYAAGDARIPTILGVGKKKKKVPIIKRPLPSAL